MEFMTNSVREKQYCKAASKFIVQLPPTDYTSADKGYDSEKLRDIIRAKSSTPVIPKKLIL
jgi:hypothetical protein